ncbi:tail protein (tape measure) [Klebsiella quasipneumoniae]|uniref:tail protein (tape measure) n=1 Tax=Klebsiella quasipneumoniae TaxID=1463165 RepID=UPI00164A3BAC|nr:tail protein (tape measure) [Klebsiella quasipneumoniae]MBC4641790.1 tail protein (tape measure) [Klebsiella quasipneumoniae]MBC4693716.1 tail protein (tape measure) [Klebsiella quasipneumoniae]MBC4720321.1 tail protein (tape measure) [Klebsiella quasipneumoniae]MDL4002788.1 tail protein (tape measure) [Klebsiella quasipneumoniae]MDL4052016.1 tail protein (tape measure) [Klebsiella quasipneumoniae]
MAEGENLGGVYIEIEADVAKLLTGQQQANKALDNIGDNAQKTSGQFKKLDTQLNATSKVMSSGLKGSVQQAGYQIQDFIVQVQGGQSALVAFSQQGSQLAGAFGPGGAIVGALIALGTVVAGTLISSLNGGKSAMDALKDAAERMNDVISISTQGIAALSDKYANLARVNATAATLLRNQAAIEYNQAISKIPKAIGDAADSFLSFGDKAISAFGGGYASIDGFNDRLKSLNITTDDYKSAMNQAYGAGQAFSATANSIGNTVGAVASRLGISEEAAFGLTKQLADLSDNPSPQALQTLALRIGDMISSSKNAKPELVELYNKIVDLSTGASQAAFNFEMLKKSTDNLTAGQKSLIQQSERNLALSKLQGAARAKLAAQYAAEDAGFSKDDPHTKRMMDDAAATYTNLDSHKKLTAEQKKGESQAERNAKVVEEYSQKAKLAADSTSELSREQAILAAKQKLTNATPQQVAQVERDAAAAWDTANALKAQAAAQKLLPETRENASYQQDMKDLKTALDGKRITQQQYDQTSEQLEAQHQANLAKIRSQQVVNPTQQALAEVDPVQQLANQHAQELALIQQFEQQGVLAHENALALKNAADRQYEQQRIAAQWEILSQQSLGYNMLTSAVDAFSGNASNAITGLLTGTMSAQEAMRSLGNTILNSVINSIVQVGVEALKNYILGQTLGAASVATSVGLAATTASAWAPAAAMASLASFGANAGPAAAGISSTVGLASGLALAGGRKNGGPVTAGNVYPVGEGDLPEFMQTRKGLFMIPGDNGTVFSNKDVTGGMPRIKKASTGSEYQSQSIRDSGSTGSQSSKSISVNVQFYDQTSGGQHSFQAQASQEGGVVTVEAFLTDVDRNGPMSSAIQSAYGLGRKAQGAY